MKIPKIIKIEDISKSNFLQLKRAYYEGGKQWDFVERNHKNKDKIDAVVGFPTYICTTGLECFVIIKQFRYSINAWVFEFPAGLVDKDSEEFISTLNREIYEETGFKVNSSRGTSCITLSSSGLSNETVALVPVEVVDYSLKLKDSHFNSNNPHFIRKIETVEGELIEVFLLPKTKQAYNYLLKFCEQNNILISARLGAILI